MSELSIKLKTTEFCLIVSWINQNIKSTEGHHGAVVLRIEKKRKTNWTHSNETDIVVNCIPNGISLSKKPCRDGSEKENQK